VEVIVYRILFVLLYVVLSALLLSTTLGFPGNWLLVGVALVIALVTKFSAMTWPYLLVCVGLAAVGEILESILGAVIVGRRGGGRWAIGGSVVGGFAGVVLGAGVVPPLGSVLLGFVGAFAGAVAGEYTQNRRVDPALRIGLWSVVGRVAAVTAKLAVGCGILWVIVSVTWP
jgi:uncharacterized protein YqgC (DUF456 family)